MARSALVIGLVLLVALVGVSTCAEKEDPRYTGLKRDTRKVQEHGYDMSFIKQYPESWPMLGPYGVYDQSVETSSQFRFKMILKKDSLFQMQFCAFSHNVDSFINGPAKLAAISFLTWWALYRALLIVLPMIFTTFFKGMSEHKIDLVCVKTVSIIHSVVSSVLGFMSVSSEDLLDNYVCGYNFLVEFTLCTVIGYMLFDGMKVYQTSGFTGWPTMTIHHVNIIPVFFIGLYYRVGLRWVVAYVINEASSPFLQISWFMLKFGNPKGTAFKLNNFMAFLAFIGFRGVYNAYVVWRQVGAMMVYPYIPLVYVLLLHGAVHLLVNWYWCTLFMIQIFLLVTGKSSFTKETADKMSMKEGKEMKKTK